MKLTITTNIEQVKRELMGQQKQVLFAASKALNATAKEVQKGVPAMLQKSLDRPTPFTTSEKSTFIKHATKDQLTASVFFKDRQASYLRWQVEGGLRAPTNKALRLPSAVQLDQFGNLPRGIIKQLISIARKESKLQKRTARRIKVSNKLEIFYGDPKDGGGKNFPPGIYKIVKLGIGRSRLIPLIVFPAVSARYTKRIDFEGMARPIVASTFGPEFEKALRDALSSAT